MYFILYLSETSLLWAAPHLTIMHNFLYKYIRLSVPWGLGMHRLSRLAERQRHSSQRMITVRLETPTSRLAEKISKNILLSLTNIEIKYMKHAEAAAL